MIDQVRFGAGRGDRLGVAPLFEVAVAVGDGIAGRPKLLGALETRVTGTVAEARVDGDIAADVDPAAVARFAVALAIGYHVTYTTGMPEPDHAAWTRLMTRVVASLRA